MLFNKNFLKLPKNEKDIEKNIKENENEQDDFKNSDFEEDDGISEVFQNKSSILTMLFLFALMIAFVLFIFYKMNR